MKSLVSDEFCEDFPHNLIPTPGYWIECSRQKIAFSQHPFWDDSEESDEMDTERHEKNQNDQFENEEDSGQMNRYLTWLRCQFICIH